MTEPVQGDAPQGGEATETPLESFLSSVPENMREHVEPYLKEAEKNVNSRLQEAAEIKKTWEPYEPVKDSLSAYTPEQLNQLFSWHQHVTSSDDAWNEWFGQEAKNAGYSKAEVDALEDAEEAGDLSKEDIQKLIEEKAAEQVGPIAEQLTELQNERQISALEQDIRGRMTELEKEHDQKFSEDQKAVIFDLGKDAPDDADWVKIGYDRYMAIVAAGQKDFVDGKSKMPGSPMKGGGGEERLKSPTDIKEVEAQARERMRQAMQS